MRYVFILVLFFAGIGPLRAQTIRQRSTTEGLSLGLQGNYLSWSSDLFQFLDERSSGGFGGGGRIGYGFSQRFEVFAQYDLNTLPTTDIQAQSFRFSHLTGGVRVNFSATTHALRPYAEVGYSLQAGKVNQIINQNGDKDNILFKGGTGHLGAGLNYFVSLPVAISVGGSVQVGGKLPIQLNGTPTGEMADVRSFRLSAGIILFISEL